MPLRESPHSRGDALCASRKLWCYGVVVVLSGLAPARAFAQSACPPLVTTCQTTYYTPCATCPGGCQQVSVYYPINTLCESDNKICTQDLCDGAGHCAHIDVTTFISGSVECESDNNACTYDNCVPGAICAHTPTPGALCASDANPCTSDLCDATGACTHVSMPGNYVLCPGIVGGVASSCTAAGVCGYTCTTGYKSCGTGCIPVAECCTSADCSAPAHATATCSGAGGLCTFACNSGYKLCNGGCIANAACCTAADCNAPPICHKSPGVCTAGTCAYPNNDGAPCNADSNACTPNDSCLGGSCVADTAHLVKCVQRECHTAPSCNTATGNCQDVAVANGNACGGNGCTAVGACTAGVCSSPPKNCSAENTDCKVGVCDPSLPSASNCTTTNVVNGTACTLADKCQLTTACNGGVCTGTPKTCTPSGPCRVAQCSASTGACEESVAPVGTSCKSDVACVQNTTCDAHGNCAGETAPDGTPCDGGGCAGVSTCVTGACTCLSSADLGGSSMPAGIVAGGDDAGVPGDDAGVVGNLAGPSMVTRSGCVIAGPGGARPNTAPLSLLALCATFVYLRDRRAARRRAERRRREDLDVAIGAAS